MNAEMGGEGAILEPSESVSGIIKVLHSVDPGKSGKFFRYDGSELPW